MNRAETSQLLHYVAEYDQREIDADLITRWHARLHELDLDVACEAVNIHHKVNPWAATPDEILKLASEIGTRTTTQAPMRRARMGAYNVTGSLNEPCGDCNAAAGEFCVNRDGEQTAGPHITRLLGRPVHSAPQHGKRRRIV
ncbi:hypothetical protein ACWIGI_28565 [Nocardia sp. NPDC055321]